MFFLSFRYESFSSLHMDNSFLFRTIFVKLNSIIGLLNFSVRRVDVLSMLKTVFSTITVAMRYEPANAKFFETEVCNAYWFL